MQRMRNVGMAVLMALGIMTGSVLAAGTGSVDRVSGWFPAGTNLTVTATPATNDELKGWTGGTNSATFGAATITFLVNAPKTITATFVDIMRTITASAGSNGSISPLGEQSVAQGDDLAFTIVPVANYHIADVLVDGSSVGAVGSYTFSNVLANATIAATFAINTYDVNFLQGLHGTLSGEPTTQTIDHGADATPPTITAAAGYAANGWNGSFTGITSGRTLTALYTTNSYTLTFNSDGGSTVDDITQAYTTAVTVPTAPTKTGHTFTGWTPAVPTTMPLDGGAHTAQWTANDFSFIVSSAHGTPSPAGTNYYAYGTSVEFAMAGSPDTIPSNTMYEVTGWVRTGSEPATGTTTNGSFAITNDTTMTWQWSTNFWVDFTIIGE